MNTETRLYILNTETVFNYALELLKHESIEDAAKSVIQRFPEIPGGMNDVIAALSEIPNFK